MTNLDLTQELVFQYTNWRGQVSVRRVVPQRIWFGESEWHAGPQWFVEAVDLEKGETRDFALVDMLFEKTPRSGQNPAGSDG